MKYVKIGDVATFQNGFAFKSKDFVTDGKYRIIKIKELKNGFIEFFDNSASVNIDINENNKKYTAKNGDILFALTGDPVSRNNPSSWVGRVSLYSHDDISFINQRVCKLIPTEKVNPLYIYYYF
ncbi:MAG: restriction endonuclease subunit S, partial [Ruminococcus sp.]|nr:restriction endonuclease subunit S [Ruminococcus sp.]